MNPSNKIKLSVLLTIAAFPTLSYAEDVQTGELPEVTVSGKRPAQSGSRLDSGSKDSLDILDGQKLKSARSTSLGQTVERISGVQNSSFGPGNGTPQIRSLGGTRVKLMENGLGISDTAAFGGNLPTAVHPFMADKITVHKSSTAVLYGGNAIGGAVNVETGQIPDELPEKNWTGKAEVSGGYNTPHTELLSLDGKIGKIAWHVDGINSKISHYRIPGNSKADACYNSVGERHYFPLGKACQFDVQYDFFFNKGYYRYVMQNYLDRGEAWRDMMGLDYADIYRTERPQWGNWAENPLYDPSITSGRGQTVKSITHITPNEHGKLTNSHQHTRNFSVGASYIGSQGYAGIGVSRYLTDYGMPGYSFLRTRSHLDGSLPTNISADQTRWTAEAQYRPNNNWLDNVKTQLAYTDAENRELLADHFVSSIDSRSTQLRVELNHKIGSLVRGSAGLDWKKRRTGGEGIDRLMPDTQSQSYGIFALEKLNYRNWEAEIGSRIGRVSHTPNFNGFKPMRSYGGSLENKQYRYSLNSNQAALSWKPFDAWRIGIRHSRSQRAPEINELFAANHHFAVFANENGNTDLKKETAKTWELSNEFKWKNSTLKAAYYHTAFDNYIYLNDSGTEVEWMPLRYWQQGDTKIRGFELEFTHLFDLNRAGNLEARLFADLVKNYPAENHSSCSPEDSRNREKWLKCVRSHNQGKYMPAMPASRYGIGLEWSKGNWLLGSSLTRYTAQKRRGRAIYEEPNLGGYNIWDAYLSYTRKLPKDLTLEWFADARNLGNVEARPHNSTLKYLAPLPGRSLRTGLRLNF